MGSLVAIFLAMIGFTVASIKMFDVYSQGRARGVDFDTLKNRDLARWLWSLDEAAAVGSQRTRRAASVASVGALGAVLTAVLTSVFRLDPSTERGLGLWLVAAISVTLAGVAVRTERSWRRKLAAGFGMLALAGFAAFAALGG